MGTLHHQVGAGRGISTSSDIENWTHVEDGKVTRVRVTFDPRPLAPPS